MNSITHSDVRIRRSVHDKGPIQCSDYNRLINSLSPIRSPNEKLPFLIKGRVILNTSKKQRYKKALALEDQEFVIASVHETDKGLIRDYNEDKVSIFKDSSNSSTPVYFYGLYDGHGGDRCAEFLKQNLHEYILKDSNLHIDPKNVIMKAFIKAENSFIEEAKRNGLDRSGSCVIIILIIKDKCYVANLGDSRAVLSSNKGSKVFCLSRDHKPFEQVEMARIMKVGGYVYQSSNYNSIPISIGPYRVFPGRLSVSRTIGDIYAKLSQYGGNSNAIISTPEIKNFKILPEHDFVLMCSDGIFDKVDNNQAIDCIWQSFKETYTLDITQRCNIAARKLISLAFERNTSDNVTVILIALSNSLN